MPRHHDHRQAPAAGDQHRLQFQPAQAGHPHIGQHATDRLLGRRLQESLGGRMVGHGESDRFEQKPQRGPHGLVIVNDMHDSGHRTAQYVAPRTRSCGFLCGGVVCIAQTISATQAGR